jgi:hypothetical protein
MTSPSAIGVYRQLAFDRTGNPPCHHLARLTSVTIVKRPSRECPILLERIGALDLYGK